MFVFSFALMAVAYRSFNLFIFVEFRVDSSLFMTLDWLTWGGTNICTTRLRRKIITIMIIMMILFLLFVYFYRQGQICVLHCGGKGWPRDWRRKKFRLWGWVKWGWVGECKKGRRITKGGKEHSLGELNETWWKSFLDASLETHHCEVWTIIKKYICQKILFLSCQVLIAPPHFTWF